MKEHVNLTTPVTSHEASLRSLAVWLTLGLGTPLRVSVHLCTSHCRAHSVSWTTQEDGAICRTWSHLVSRGRALSFRVPLRGRIATARSVRESAVLVLVVPNCMFRVALLEGGTFVAGKHVPHKVEHHRACRGESTLHQEEEMYGVRQVLSATTAGRCSQS